MFTIALGFLCAYTVDLLDRCESEVVRQLNSLGNHEPGPGGGTSSRSSASNNRSVQETKPLRKGGLRKLTYPQLGAVLFPEATVPGTDINLMAILIYVGECLPGWRSDEGHSGPPVHAGSHGGERKGRVSEPSP